jgi:hypothetical protein
MSSLYSSFTWIVNIVTVGKILWVEILPTVAIKIK